MAKTLHFLHLGKWKIVNGNKLTNANGITLEHKWTIAPISNTGNFKISNVKTLKVIAVKDSTVSELAEATPNINLEWSKSEVNDSDFFTLKIHCEGKEDCTDGYLTAYKHNPTESQDFGKDKFRIAACNR